MAPSYASLDSLKDFGEFEIEQQSKIKKLGAKSLTESWNSIPPVTHFEEIDIALIEEQRKTIKISNKINPFILLGYKVVASLQISAIQCCAGWRRRDNA